MQVKADLAKLLCRDLRLIQCLPRQRLQLNQDCQAKLRSLVLMPDDFPWEQKLTLPYSFGVQPG
ncbi:hypothetical protein PCC6912_06780 [Chlorogloeopsis fritschii PCC 6912]|uniref:Uncharacterized protein n=1 Tax=Chlorogloeopsis fritschii PCC 6912 TaxID=211165 RepID=A0A433NPX8_CHLFR|nr:hypothetical protein PCC6912_06780 [Chlorogloeopsis fritschii PCC 6912]